MKLVPVANPPNPYLTQHAEWLGPPPAARLEVYAETARSILSENDSPDLPFRWSVNPYRGCQHACAYCYARRYHEYLGWGAGTDFDVRLVAKVNAPALLRKALTRRGWRGECINFSGVTDCYQPIEASYELTRKCLQVCLELKNPIAVVTKSFLVVRDAELLCELNRKCSAEVFISIPFADAEHAALVEPTAPPPGRRFEAVRRLRQAGVPVGVFIAPVIPGLNDSQIPEILRLAAEAGAQSAGFSALRLSGNVENVFLERLRQAMPQRADKVVARIRDMRGGCMSDGRFGHRMRGAGPYWESIERLMEVSKRRYGLVQMGRCEPDGCGQGAAVGVANAYRFDEYVPLARSKPAMSSESVQLQFDFGQRREVPTAR